MKWQEEFIQLYTSGNLENVHKAFELKSKYIPQKLYRYRPISQENLCYRKKEIAEGELFLSHPEKLNDPFECWSVLHSNYPRTYVDKITYADYYLKTGQTKELSSMLQSEDWFDALLDVVASKTSSTQEAEEIKLALENSIMISMEKFNKELRKRIIEMIRFACFSTTATNLPMWYHYASERKGICLEYSTSDITDKYQQNSLFPVQYVEQLPDMTYMLAHRNETSTAMPTYLSFHKLKDWAYEQEWRLIYDSGYWTRKGRKLPSGFEKDGVVIDFIKPSKVILGTDIDSDIGEEIIICAKEGSIPVTKARLTEYGISVD